MIDGWVGQLAGSDLVFEVLGYKVVIKAHGLLLIVSRGLAVLCGLG